MQEWKNRIVGLEEVDPTQLHENPANYRNHPEQQQEMMDGTLGEIGWIQTVIANKTTGNLIDGHMRVRLAIQRKEKTVPVIWVNLTPEEENLALASFDPIGHFAKEEKDKLQDLLRGVQTKSGEMIDLIAKVAKKNRINLDSAMDDSGNDDQEDKDQKLERERREREKIRDKWKAEPGKVWRVESINLPGQFHRLMCGDSSIPEDVDLLTQGSKSFLMVTDPPYGINFEEKFNPRSKDWDAISGDGLKNVGLQQWLSDLLKLWQLHMYDDSAYYIWSAVFDEGFAIYNGIKDSGIHIQSQIVWSKNAFSLGQTDYHWQHEICWYGFKLGAKHRWFGGRDQSTIWSISKVPNQRYLHPMQKPVELYAIPIKNHTHAGDLCFDPFLGSGTQIEAAEQSGRICYGMEQDPIWAGVALQRLYDLGLQAEEE